MKWLFLILYIFILVALVIFSWTFIDNNFPLKQAYLLSRFIWNHREIATVVYLSFIGSLFLCYGYFLLLIKNKRVGFPFIATTIGITVLILFFSWPAFAYDIFNYIATAKVTFFYRENPYLVMPIDIPNEPMLAFMHAANKVALYGFVWILLSAIPWLLGLGNLILTIFTFKGFVILFYLGLLWLIWQISEKNLKALAFFALNPLVITETLISGHNDVVMMAFALSAFYVLKKNRFLFSLILLFLSVFIKFASLALLPVFFYIYYLRLKHRKINWNNIWKLSAIMMYMVFFLSPLREEIYSWYLIWPLTFVALATKESLLAWVSVGFSFGLPLRFAPYLLTGNWGGVTPLVKKLVTFLPALITGIYDEIRKKI